MCTVYMHMQSMHNICQIMHILCTHSSKGKISLIGFHFHFSNKLVSVPEVLERMKEKTDCLLWIWKEIMLKTVLRCVWKHVSSLTPSHPPSLLSSHIQLCSAHIWSFFHLPCMYRYISHACCWMEHLINLTLPPTPSHQSSTSSVSHILHGSASA